VTVENGLRRRRVDDIYLGALHLAPHERSAFLDRACGDDAALRADVQSLLDGAIDADRLLETPLGAVAALAIPTEALPPESGAFGTTALQSRHVRLAPGTRLGGYTVSSLLGVGAMGEVYRAHDPTLGRDVALKLLPESLAADPARAARFDREARLLASLSHPNIAAIYGVIHDGHTRALVLELVDGTPLDTLLAGGPLALNRALDIASQIADGLDAAHERGVIHRDLKPGNVRLTMAGLVKLLDFGIAKSVGDTEQQVRSTLNLTTEGAVMGTARYMSPEQARGEIVDKRTDIWAFGCVLYEMLTAQPAFSGGSPAAVIAAILEREPRWELLPAETPSGVGRLLRRCLLKDPRRRLRDIADARTEIEDLRNVSREALPPAPATNRRRQWAAYATWTVGGALVASIATWTLTRDTPQVRRLPSRFEIVQPPTQSLALVGSEVRDAALDRDIAISPDGRYIAYRAGGGQLVVRALDSLDARVMAGITNVRGPFFSPDSRWIGFFDGRRLKKISIAGGPAATICPIQGDPRGASWGDDDAIVFATQDTSTGLLRVSAGGGEPTVLTMPDAAKGERAHYRPSVLPGGRGILFTIFSPQPEMNQVAVLDLETRERKIVVRGAIQPEYVDGHLLYANERTIFAIPFDIARLAVLGVPVPVIDDLSPVNVSAAANYAISRSGTLVYVAAAAGVPTPRSLVWVDRKGHETVVAGAPQRLYTGLRLSPDGMRIAVSIDDQEKDIWIWDFGRGTFTRLIFDGEDRDPVWTSDNQYIVFSSRAKDTGALNLFRRLADGRGAAERLTVGDNNHIAAFVDRTGILGTVISPKFAGDVVWFPLEKTATADTSSGTGSSLYKPLVQTEGIDHNPALSPDGRFLAYQSNQSGPNQINVRPFPQVNTGVWQVSTSGGTRPVWARNGRELFFLDSATTLTAVPVETSAATFNHGNPAKVLEATYFAPSPLDNRSYDISPDGQRFLMIKEDARDRSVRAVKLVVFLDWTEELKTRMAGVR
jgi:serine/threonine-protein kinase